MPRTRHLTTCATCCCGSLMAPHGNSWRPSRPTAVQCWPQRRRASAASSSRAPRQVSGWLCTQQQRGTACCSSTGALKPEAPAPARALQIAQAPMTSCHASSRHGLVFCRAAASVHVRSKSTALHPSRMHHHVQMGLAEDPVTGSAHTLLAPYWLAHPAPGSRPNPQQQLSARQCSKRGADVRLQVKGDRAVLQGHAVVVLSGKLHV